MRLFNVKKIIGIATLGLALIGGVIDTEAQGWGNIARNQRQSIRQEQRLEKQRLKLEQERLRLERERLETLQAQSRYRVYGNGGLYHTDSRGAELLRQAVMQGYRQGFAAGRADRNRRVGLNWGGSTMYRSGSLGWRSHVDRSQYQYYFRQGFERGYRDGYNSRYQYGTNNNGALNILGSVLGSILNIQRY